MRPHYYLGSEKGASYILLTHIWRDRAPPESFGRRHITPKGDMIIVLVKEDHGMSFIFRPRGIGLMNMSTIMPGHLALEI